MNSLPHSGHEGNDDDGLTIPALVDIDNCRCCCCIEDDDDDNVDVVAATAATPSLRGDDAIVLFVNFSILIRIWSLAVFVVV